MLKSEQRFFCVPRGPFMGTCPNAKYPHFNFPNLIKKNPNQKINFSGFQKLLAFLSSGCSFFQFKVK